MASLDWDKAEMYWQAITMIEAQQLLIQMRVSAYPQMKQADQRKWHKSIYQAAYPAEQAETLSTEEIGRRLRAAIHG